MRTRLIGEYCKNPRVSSWRNRRCSILQTSCAFSDDRSFLIFTTPALAVSYAPRESNFLLVRYPTNSHVALVELKLLLVWHPEPCLDSWCYSAVSNVTLSLLYLLQLYTDAAILPNTVVFRIDFDQVKINPSLNRFSFCFRLNMGWYNTNTIIKIISFMIFHFMIILHMTYFLM